MTITDSSVYSQTHSRFCDSRHFLRPKWKDEKDSVLNWTLLYLKSGRILTSNHRLSIFCAFFLRTWERTNFSLILPRTVTTKTLWMLTNLGNKHCFRKITFKHSFLHVSISQIYVEDSKHRILPTYIPNYISPTNNVP